MGQQIIYPPHWEVLLDCLSPFHGMNGTALADSERSLVTHCDPAKPTSAKTEPRTATEAHGAKRVFVISPVSSPAPKRTKKEDHLSTLTTSVTTLVDHMLANDTNKMAKSDVRFDGMKDNMEAL